MDHQELNGLTTSDLIHFPTGTTQPLTSYINGNSGQSVANFTTVGLNATGQMSLCAHVSGTDAPFRCRRMCCSRDDRRHRSPSVRHWRQSYAR